MSFEFFFIEVGKKWWLKINYMVLSILRKQVCQISVKFIILYTNAEKFRYDSYLAILEFIYLTYGVGVTLQLGKYYNFFGWNWRDYTVRHHTKSWQYCLSIKWLFVFVLSHCSNRIYIFTLVHDYVLSYHLSNKTYNVYFYKYIYSYILILPDFSFLITILSFTYNELCYLTMHHWLGFFYFWLSLLNTPFKITLVHIQKVNLMVIFHVEYQVLMLLDAGPNKTSIYF